MQILEEPSGSRSKATGPPIRFRAIAIDRAGFRNSSRRELTRYATHCLFVVARVSRQVSAEQRVAVLSAIMSLGEMGPAAASAVPLLRKFLHDRSNTGPWVRANAAEALAQIGP